MQENSSFDPTKMQMLKIIDLKNPLRLFNSALEFPVLFRVLLSKVLVMLLEF
jgi:hypothetical protein